jgi:hypothetical protein
MYQAPPVYRPAPAMPAGASSKRPVLQRVTQPGARLAPPVYRPVPAVPNPPPIYRPGESPSAQRPALGYTVQTRPSAIQRSAAAATTTAPATSSRTPLARNLANEGKAIDLLNREGRHAIKWEALPESAQKDFQASFGIKKRGTPDFVVDDTVGDVFTLSPSAQAISNNLEALDSRTVTTFYRSIINGVHTKLTKYTGRSICIVDTSGYRNFDTPTFLALWAETYPALDITDRVFQIDQNNKLQPISGANARRYAAWAHSLGVREQLRKYREGVAAEQDNWGAPDLGEEGLGLPSDW